MWLEISWSLALGCLLSCAGQYLCSAAEAHGRRVPGTLHPQDDGLGRSPIAHANSMPLSDGGAPPVAAGGDGKAKLTSLASAAGLPKIEPEDEPDAAEVPGELMLQNRWSAKRSPLAAGHYGPFQGCFCWAFNANLLGSGRATVQEGGCYAQTVRQWEMRPRSAGSHGCRVSHLSASCSQLLEPFVPTWECCGRDTTALRWKLWPIAFARRVVSPAACVRPMNHHRKCGAASCTRQQAPDCPSPSFPSIAASLGAGVIAVKGDVTAIWGLLTSSYLNVLLLSVPLGYLAHALSWAPLLRFSLVISCFENVRDDRGSTACYGCRVHEPSPDPDHNPTAALYGFVCSASPHPAAIPDLGCLPL